MREPRTDITVGFLAERILFASKDRRGRRNNVIIMGAGASISAGIPGASEIAKILIRSVSERLGFDPNAAETPEEIYKKLESDGRFVSCAIPSIDKVKSGKTAESQIDWWLVYDHCFRRYFTQPDDVRHIFSELVDKSDGSINWSHLVLGELVAKGYFNTVLTTNFDQLVLSGMVRAGVIPVVCDGLESLNRIDGAPRHPQLIEIHGSRHTYLLRNDSADVSAVQNDASAIAAIQSLLHHAHAIVVVGYGGREDGLMNLLVKAGEIYPDKNIFWVQHADNADSLSEKARNFLGTSRNSGVILGQDSDRFFLELAKELRVGTPSAIGDPLKLIDLWIKQTKSSIIVDPDILAEISTASNRLDLLRKYDATSETDPNKTIAKAIRAKRLSGDIDGSYNLYNMEISDKKDVKLVSFDVVEEGVVSCKEYCALHREPEAFSLGLLSLEVLWSTPTKEIDRQRLASLASELSTAGVNARAEAKYVRKSLSLQRKVLLEISRLSQPELWADVQHGIGNALVALAERTQSQKYADQAIEVFKKSQEIRRPDRDIERWAATQNGIGNALSYIARRTHNSDLLQMAADAYLLAIDRLSMDQQPALYALVQGNLCSVYKNLYDANGLEANKVSALAAAELSYLAYQRANLLTQADRSEARYKLMREQLLAADTFSDEKA